MSVRFVLCILLSLPGIAMADADDGEFMGYRLGDQYAVGPDTQKRVTTIGNLVITAEQPVKPDVIEQVNLVTTGKTFTIGSISASQRFATEPEARDSGRRFFGLLRAKYPSWAYGWEVMDAQMNITAVSLRQPPYELGLKISQDTQLAEKPWRFSITLAWIALSEPDNAWRAKSSSELIRLEQKEQKKFLDDADSRGL